MRIGSMLTTSPSAGLFSLLSQRRKPACAPRSVYSMSVPIKSTCQSWPVVWFATTWIGADLVNGLIAIGVETLDIWGRVNSLLLGRD